MFRGVTSNGINREVSSILECARLNQNKKVQSLAIPETSLLFLARDHLALLRRTGAHNGEEMKLVSKSILKGILPSLQYVVHRHKKMTEEASTMWSKGGKHVKVSIDPKPNAWQNPGNINILKLALLETIFHFTSQLLVYRSIFYGPTRKWRFHLQVLLGRVIKFIYALRWM